MENGPLIPSKLIGGKKIPKKPDEYDEKDFKKVTLNFLAMNILCCALEPEEYNCVSKCETANAIWRTLEVTYEGFN